MLPLKINVNDGAINLAGKKINSDHITISTDQSNVLTLAKSFYRGTFKIYLNDDKKTIDVVNHLSLEAYIAGVVGAEMPAYWEPAALDAQAVACRTYCLYVQKHYAQKRRWDLRPSQAYQVYRGIKAETKPILQAVNRTRGKILVDPQTDQPIPAYYSSSCGGHTADGSEVFSTQASALHGVKCPYCREVTKTNNFYWPAAIYDKNDVEAKLKANYASLKKLKTIDKIEAEGYIDHGNFKRLTKIRLTDPNGKNDWLRAEDFRLTIDPAGRTFKSTVCRIVETKTKWMFVEGRGFGHGVGLCQCGAQGMARKGATADEILTYYYSESKIKKLYK
jgi:stage II sporulation protein D